MNVGRWTMLCLALLFAGFLVFGLPHPAAASANDIRPFGYRDPAQATQPPGQPIITVPGAFSLRLGQGFSSQDGRFRVENTQVDLPAINATASVNGISYDIRTNSFAWDNIVLTQQAPIQNEAVTVTGMQAIVQGQAANYSTDFSARVDVHPNENVQFGAKVGLSYDGLTGQPALRMSDGSAQIVVGPANIAVAGLNADGSMLSIDTAQVAFPEAGMGLRLEGYTLADGKSDWKALTWVGQEFTLGNAMTLTNNLVIVPGPSNTDLTAIGATTHFQIRLAENAQAGGQLVLTYDPATQQSSLALRDGSAAFGRSGWTLGINGINASQSGATVDSVVLSAEAAGVQAQVTGLAANSTDGVTFEQARLLYLPDQTTGSGVVAGFELVVDSTEMGYLVTTRTAVPTARVSQ